MMMVMGSALVSDEGEIKACSRTVSFSFSISVVGKELDRALLSLSLF